MMQEFPKWKYPNPKDGRRAVIVASEAEEAALEGEWADSPAAFSDQLSAVSEDDRSLAVAALKDAGVSKEEPVDIPALIGKALKARRPKKVKDDDGSKSD